MIESQEPNKIVESIQNNLEKLGFKNIVKKHKAIPEELVRSNKQKQIPIKAIEEEIIIYEESLLKDPDILFVNMLMKLYKKV